jgi:hypothetical protein
MSEIAQALTPIVKIAAPVAGFVGNLLGQRSQNAYTNNQTAYQQWLQNLSKNPAQLSSMVNKATQPLSGALIQGVNNSVQGDLASRGLSQAPGIFASTESQALAPYLLSQQDQARQQVLSSLQLGQGAAPNPAFPGQSNMTLALQSALGALGKFGQQQQPQQLPSQINTPPGITLPPNIGGITAPPPDVSGGLGSVPSFNPDPGMSGGGYGS